MMQTVRQQGWGKLVVVLALLCGWPAFARGQTRSLVWDSLSVQADLDAEGRLHVIETHAMRMDGAWNGGERRFRLEPRHSLELLSVREITPTASVREYVAGTLANVGEYSFADAQTLRWRSRAPSDPPFRDARRVYELRYVLSGILVESGSDFLLDHDFAFRERDGVIHRFSASLRLDSAWQPLEPQPQTIELSELAPGASAVRRFTLRYTRAGQPAGVVSGTALLGLMAASPTRAAGLFGGLLLLTAAWFALILKRERASGHLDLLPNAALIDRTWLDQHIFCHPAEVIGAAWDRHIGAPEVAALIARLTAEGKLRSQVMSPWSGQGAAPLQIELCCDRKQFRGYERELIEGLFVDGNTTDTNRIRRHYAGSGFDPAARIKPELETEVAGLFGRQEPLGKWSGKLLLVAALWVALILNAPTVPRPATVPWTLACTFMTLLCWGFARFHAGKYRDTVTDLRVRGRNIALAVGLLLLGLACVHLAFDTELSTTQFLLIELLTLMAFWNIDRTLKPRELAVSYQLRRQIAAVREYFARELESQSPRIEDAWLPYLIAFDLGPDMDLWFRAFGATPTTGAGAWDQISTATSSASTPQGWSGGGGAFGGAGASGAWVMGIGAIAAGVSAPSSNSSSSSSSSESSSSSGGGGGGGW